jgi:hypothetical protein
MQSRVDVKDAGAFAGVERGGPVAKHEHVGIAVLSVSDPK